MYIYQSAHGEKSQGKQEKKNVKKKSGNLDLVREVQNLGKRQGNIISYTHSLSMELR